LPALVIVVGLVASTALSQQNNNEQPSERSVRARASLQARFPRVRFYERGSRITRLYGAAFGSGRSPEDTAERFRVRHAALFGVEPDDLDPRGPLADERHTQPLVYDPETGAHKFTLVYFSQRKDGVPVFRSDLRLLVRNENGYPLVLAGSGLRDLGDFSAADAGRLRSGRARDAALLAAPGLDTFSEPELVIWAGVDDMVVEPRLAVQLIGQGGSPSEPDTYQKWLFLVDARTHAILYQEDQVLKVDVFGNVSGLATEDVGADICEPESLMVMPYARVNIGETVAFADANGDFVIPNAGNSPVIVESRVQGRYFDVFNEAGPNTVLAQPVSPPGPADFVHNAANDSEFIRAEVNGYVQANRIRDHALRFAPDYPVIANQLGFDVIVNINASCGAFYTGTSINFFRALSGCSNTANSTIVHHEYGHHLVASGGSGQGQYGEGMADTMAVIVTDQPLLGVGFIDCDASIRDAKNNLQYPCNEDDFTCALLLSGCVWSTRAELLDNHPVTYGDILSNLTVNSIPLHTGNLITPQITIDFLTLDDDNDDIGDGTPHSQDICAGFGAHNMDCPPIDTFILPDTFTVVRGFLIDGGLEEVTVSDDETASMGVSTFAPPVGPPIQVEVTGTSPDDSPTELRFRFEGKVNNTPVEQEILLFDYDTQSFESVDLRTAPQTDTVIETVISSNAARFVEVGTGQMKARITWSPGGLSVYVTLVAEIDQTAWIIP
jgi:hypothetical protein